MESFFNRLKISSIPAVLFIVCVFMAGVALAGDDPMNAVPIPPSELAHYYGGFRGPDGLEIAVGVQVQNTIGGQQIAPSAATPSLPAASAQLLQNQGIDGVSALSYTNGANGSLIVNTMNNVSVQQLRQINISIANFSVAQSFANPGLMQATQQLNSALAKGLR